MQGESAFSVVRVVDSNFDGKASAVTSQARAGRESQALVGQCPLHAFGIMGDHGQVGAGRLVGLATPLLPVAEDSKRSFGARHERASDQRRAKRRRRNRLRYKAGGHSRRWRIANSTPKQVLPILRYTDRYPGSSKG